MKITHIITHHILLFAQINEPDKFHEYTTPYELHILRNPLKCHKYLPFLFFSAITKCTR